MSFMISFICVQDPSLFPTVLFVKVDKRAISRVLALVIAVIVIVAGVGGYFAYTTLFPPAPKVTEVRIGCPYPLSGTAATIGLDCKPLIEWFVDQINKEGGIKSLGGAKIKAIFADTESKPEIARVQAAKLITEDKCVVLMDGTLSGNALTQAEECEKYGVPIILGASSSPTLTESGFKYTFRHWAHDKMLARSLFAFLKELEKGSGKKVETIAIVTDNTLFGVDCGKAYKSANEDPKIGGYKIVEHIEFPIGPTDLTSEVARLKVAKPQALFLAVTTAGDCILLQRTFKKMDFNFWALLSGSGHHMPEYEAIGKTAWYAYIRLPYGPDLILKKTWVKSIADKFKELTGRGFTAYPAAAYASLVLIRETLEKCGSIDPKKIRDTLAVIDLPAEKIPLAYGIKFDENGQNIYALPVINQLQETGWRTVWPTEVATIKAIFPQPTWTERGD